ncbi:MAG: pyridoxamine 5-phosphate oxidase family protein [Ornithinibacter sp.]|nr:pyridoxamine 5-phosphate oxidase family protein [Ornithinibacter sp.]
MAVAVECGEPLVDVALGLVNQRSQEHGLPSFSRERVTEPARLRLYVAEVKEAWVLDQDSPVDERAVVPLDGSGTESTDREDGQWQS